MTEVSFTQMKDGTRADYQMLEQLETNHIRGLPDRVLTALAGLSDGLAAIRLTDFNIRCRPRRVRKQTAPASTGLLLRWFTILVMT